MDIKGEALQESRIIINKDGRLFIFHTKAPTPILNWTLVCRERRIIFIFYPRELYVTFSLEKLIYLMNKL